MTKRLLLVAAGVALAAGFVMTLPARAVPPISWQPTPFDIAVPPSGRLPTTVTALIGSAIPATRVEVTPSLAPYVASIEPTTLPALPAGSRVTINIIFQVATGTPLGTIDGTLKLRKANGTSTQAQPLPIVLTVGNLLYPPDPGEAGKRTLEGIDSDGDGVRDDIQRYIETTYPEEPVIRAGLRQFANPLQLALRDAQSEQAALEHRENIERARECIRTQVEFPFSSRITKSLIAEMLNTRDRSIAYLTWNRHLGGKTFEVPAVNSPSACAFDLSTTGGAHDTP